MEHTLNKALFLILPKLTCSFRKTICISYLYTWYVYLLIWSDVNTHCLPNNFFENFQFVLIFCFICFPIALLQKVQLSLIQKKNFRNNVYLCNLRTVIHILFFEISEVNRNSIDFPYGSVMKITTVLVAVNVTTSELRMFEMRRNLSIKGSSSVLDLL